MEKKNRLRGPNFTKSDSILLCDIINNFKDIIECKKTDGVNLMEKHKAWQEVVKIYNSSTTGSQRTLESLQQNYKNLKKKFKKSASDAKMNIPVDELVHSVEEFGTSSDGWEKISHNMWVSTETCQEVLADLKKEADRKDAILKKNVMGTGGGPAPNYDPDPLLEKVKVLVGPAIDGLYTIYDGDSCLMASQPAAEPIEAINMQIDTQGDNQHGEKITTLQHSNITQQDEEYFTNDRTNLKKKPHSLLVQNIKNKKKNHSEMPQKQSVSTKFISLASEKPLAFHLPNLVALQKELLQVQIKEETEKSEHGRLLRAMEMEDAKKRYEHNELIRKLELENIKLRFSN